MNRMQEHFPEVYDATYKDLVRLYGYELLLWRDMGDSSGDSRALFFDEHSEYFGFLTFGWGSCSGCDALFACETYEALEALSKTLHDTIVWFETDRAAYTYFATHDWEGDYAFDQVFNERALTILAAIIHASDGKTIKENVRHHLLLWKQEANN